MNRHAASITTRMKTSLPSSSDAAGNIIHATDATRIKRTIPSSLGEQTNMMRMPSCVACAAGHTPSANTWIRTGASSAIPNSMKAANIITISTLVDHRKKSRFLKKDSGSFYESCHFINFFDNGATPRLCTMREMRTAANDSEMMRSASPELLWE